MPPPDDPTEKPILPHLVDAATNLLVGSFFNAGESLIAAVKAIPTERDLFGESNVLVVDGLPPGTTAPEVEALVSPYAPPVAIKIPDDGEGAARAFVRFASFEEASKAASLHGATPHGTPLFARVVSEPIADREFPAG